MVDELFEDKAPDFSNFDFKGPSSTASSNASLDHQGAASPHKPWLRLAVACAIVTGLVVVLWIALQRSGQRGRIIAPSGYRVVTSPTSPPHLEKLK